MAYKKQGYTKEYLAKGFVQQFLDKESVVIALLENRFSVVDLVGKSFDLAEYFVTTDNSSKETESGVEVSPASFDEFDDSNLPTLDGEFE